VIENLKNVQNHGSAENSPPDQPATRTAGSERKLILGAVLIIILINLVAFHGSLRGYFLADDFAHIGYLHQVFNGHADLLVKNFYSNWMQTVGTSFYRPFISITLATDYLFWGANPNGFHLTNYLYQTASSVFLFLALSRMFLSLDQKARLSTAFVAAALFACHPLHAEVVSWIIARVDSVCTTFLFLALWLYLLARQSNSADAVGSNSNSSRAGLLNSLSIAAFAVSLMSKEMAITLPPTIFIYELVNSAIAQESKSLSWKTRCMNALKATMPHFITLMIYMVFRTLALGTVFGGYSGSVGDGLKESFWKRWLSEGCLWRLLFPFNESITAPRDFLRTIFQVTALSSLSMGIVRALYWRREPSSCLPLGLSPFAIFAAGWFVLALAPTIQVFDITQNLQGGRFVYLATAPVVLFLAALIFGQGERPGRSISFLGAISVCLSAALVISYCVLAEKNNHTWKVASRGVSNLRSGVEEKLRAAPPHSKIIILNLPPHNKGAHMLYNASMFGIALKPPLSSEDMSERVLLFEPVTFGDANLINRDRLKLLMADKAIAGIFRWNQEEEKLVEMQSWRENATAPSPDSIELGAFEPTLALEGNDALRSPDFDIASTDFDFVDVDLKIERNPRAIPPQGSVLILYWSGKTHPQFSAERYLALPLKINDGFNRYRFSVGELKTWVSEGRINGLLLDTSEKGGKIIIKSARVVRASDEIPALSPAPELYSRIDRFGIVYPLRDLGPLVYDASKLKNAKSVRYEVSAPDSWFEHYSGTYRDTGPSEHISISGKLDSLKSDNWVLALNAITKPAFYELRIMALDADGKAIGYVSNPINFQLSSDYFQRKETQRENSALKNEKPPGELK
jgi:hypothetical protein